MKKTIRLSETELTNLIERLVIEAKGEPEKGKSGVVASKSRSEYEATPKESEIIASLFGKYSQDIPPIVMRYIRKIPRKTLTKRLIDLNLIDIDTVMDEFDLTKE